MDPERQRNKSKQQKSKKDDSDSKIKPKMEERRMHNIHSGVRTRNRIPVQTEGSEWIEGTV